LALRHVLDREARYRARRRRRRAERVTKRARPPDTSRPACDAGIGGSLGRAGSGA
jgi:hypothetical protein